MCRTVPAPVEHANSNRPTNPAVWPGTLAKGGNKGRVFMVWLPANPASPVSSLETEITLATVGVCAPANDWPLVRPASGSGVGASRAAGNVAIQSGWTAGRLVKEGRSARGAEGPMPCSFKSLAVSPTATATDCRRWLHCRIGARAPEVPAEVARAAVLASPGPTLWALYNTVRRGCDPLPPRFQF